MTQGFQLFCHLLYAVLCCFETLWVDREYLQAPGWQANPCVISGTERCSLEKRHKC